LIRGPFLVENQSTSRKPPSFRSSFCLFLS